jgi:hypothetical protein
MKEKKAGQPPSPERKKTISRKEAAGRIMGVLVALSSIGMRADNHLDQLKPFQNVLTLSAQDAGEIVSPGPYCLFLSGATGTNVGIKGIKEGLEKQYGVGKVEAFNSILGNSKDPQNPERFKQIAGIIYNYSKFGLDVLAHSAGAAELVKAIDIINEEDNTFFDKKENVENLKIVLISPSGFTGNFSAIKFLRSGFGSFSDNKFLQRLIESSSPLFKGVDALIAFPPEGIAPEDLAVALRNAMPELSQLNTDIPIKTVPLITEENFLNKLTDSEREQVKIYSDMMRIAIADQNYEGLRHLIIKYGENLKEPLQKVYDGSFEPESIDEVEAMNRTVGGYIGMIQALIDMLGSRPMRKISELQERGVIVCFLVLEFDLTLTVSEVFNFYNDSDEASVRVEVIEGASHGFPALQPNEFGEIVKELEEQEVSR